MESSWSYHVPGKTVIIGVGNLYQSDDGVGLLVAQKLRGQVPSDVQVLEESGEGVALLEAWRGADVAFVVDAVRSGGSPGDIHFIEVRDEPLPVEMSRYSSHARGVTQAIEMARAHNGLPPRLVLYGIEGGNFEAGMALSPEVAKAANQVVASLLAYVEDAYADEEQPG